MAKIQDKLLLEKDGFSAYLLQRDSGIPSGIAIRKTGGRGIDLLKTDFDPVDKMTFTRVDDSLISRFEKEEQSKAINCLQEALKEKFGGKNMFSVPESMVEIFKENGFDTTPKLPNGMPYKRLMVADIEKVKNGLASVKSFVSQEKRFDETRYTIITDKKQLIAMKDDLSELLIQNAPYATGENREKEPFYSPNAMQARIEPKDVQAIAIIDNKTNKPTAFIRSYINSGVGAYVSDLVVSNEKRHQGLATQIMQEAIKLSPQTDKVFLIAGDDKEQNFYGKRLGFKANAELEEPVDLGNNQLFMFAMFPEKEILKNLPENLNKMNKVVLLDRQSLSR